MDGDVSEILEDFISGPLVTWMETLESLADSTTEQPPTPWEKKRQEGHKEYFLQLVGGNFLIHVMEIIDLIPGGVQPRWNKLSDETQKLQMLQTLLQRLRRFYQDELQQLILTSPPNIYLLARDPLTAQGVKEMKKLLLLLLGGAVQCEQRDEIIGHIQTLDIDTQAALASAIQEVTQEPENMLRLQWKELAPLEMERLLRDLVSRIRDLVHERDAGLEKLWELQQGQQEPPQALPSENNHQHLGVQLAETRAQVRRLQHELEEKMEELLEQQDELKDLEGQLHKMRQENRKLAGEARQAGLYRDELDAFREKALRTERLQADLMALKERLPALEHCRVQLKEEREFSQALMETKAMLEGQLEAVHTRGQRLNQLEKEKEKLQHCLSQAQEERDQLYHQTEELLTENLALERQLRRSLGEPLDLLRAEELESDWAPDEPYEVPLLLSYEVREAGRLPALERENQELRRRLQEALDKANEPGSLGREQKPMVRLQRKVDPQAKEKDFRDHLPTTQTRQTEEKRSEAEGLASEMGKSQALESETKALLSGMEKTLSEAQTSLREAEQQREAEARRASGLEERLRSLQEVHAKALEKLEREREQRGQEAERLVEEVHALERERETLQAGSQALQAAAAQAEFELGEVRRSLQEEQLQGARLAQKARQAEEDVREAQRELEALQRSLEQHKVALAQLEAEKGALEEALSQAESQRRQLDTDNRRMKAQTQAQEEALAAQNLRLVHLESQSRQQVMELSRLQDISQRVSELEQEKIGLKEELDARCKASTILEKDLQREKAKGKENETTLSQLREQLLRKEEGSKEELWTRQCNPNQELREKPSPGKKLEEDNSTLKRQLQELHALNQRLTHDLQQAKSSSVVPLSLEEPPVTQNTEGQKESSFHLPPFQANTESEALSARLIEVEHRNAALQAEKLVLTTRLGQLESQVSSLQGALLSLQGQSSEVKEESGRWQKQSNELQVETASLRSQKALLDSQALEMRERLAALEAEARQARQEREEWRGRYEALLRDHDRLTVLHERQGADLEGLLGKHASLKGALRNLEQEHRELQGRHSQLLGQKVGLEEREEVLRGQQRRLEESEQHHQELTKQHSHLMEEHERVKQALAQTERAQDDLQGELRGLRNRMTGLQLEQARLEAENGALKEQNQQLDTALGRLSTQCELLAQLKGNQEEENRHLLQEIQALSRENRRLLEHSMESREHFQEEQRQYLDKLGELRREKQKLVEKIMDQYRVLEPALPRGKKSNWITEKLKKLRKPRREAPREQLRPMAEGAGSSESLTGQEGTGVDGADSSVPSSPSPLRKASSILSIQDAKQVHFRRHRLSSRMPAMESAGPRNGEEHVTPRQRFRQRRLGMLGGSQEEAAAATAEWQIPRQISTSSQEERGPPLGEEEQTSKEPAVIPDVLERESSKSS
ncbi:coiled-coil domain-containing protein 88B [Eublepharis macularius]|uniref:Coiled-coil domain-containing protein 88B n=1 Tax=Eublepharis macularius TaxID=481883 RepID=A0AA97J0K4_EUBMA|nr:coiled-coil domain-containing protein 88B [Eublepharis macularius]